MGNITKLTADTSKTVDQIFDKVNADLTLQETNGTLTANGTLQYLYLNNSPLGSFKPLVMLVDLDNMQAGDAICVRTYYRLVDGGGYRMHDYFSYTGLDGGLPQGKEIISIGLLPNRFGILVTLHQYQGTYRDFVWEVLVEN